MRRSLGRFLRVDLLVLATSLGASACAPTGSTQNISPRPVAGPGTPGAPPANPGSGVLQSQLGFVAGSQQAQTTSLGYQSFSSVGEPASGIVQTTALGYKAYSSVQGNVAAE